MYSFRSVDICRYFLFYVAFVISAFLSFLPYLVLYFVVYLVLLLLCLYVVLSLCQALYLCIYVFCSVFLFCLAFVSSFPRWNKGLDGRVWNAAGDPDVGLEHMGPGLLRTDFFY